LNGSYDSIHIVLNAFKLAALTTSGACVEISRLQAHSRECTEELPITAVFVRVEQLFCCRAL